MLDTNKTKSNNKAQNQTTNNFRYKHRPDLKTQSKASRTVRALIQKPRGRVLEFLWVFWVVGRFPWDSSRVSYPLGSIQGSLFLWLCFCRQKPPASRRLSTQISTGFEDQASPSYLRLVTQCLIVGPDHKTVTKRPYN